MMIVRSGLIGRRDFVPGVGRRAGGHVHRRGRRHGHAIQEQYDGDQRADQGHAASLRRPGRDCKGSLRAPGRASGPESRLEPPCDPEHLEQQDESRESDP